MHHWGMDHNIPLITTIAAGLGLALVLGFVAARLKLPALVGYLLAGVVIGPFTPGFVADTHLASQLLRRQSRPRAAFFMPTLGRWRIG